jgi:hypothetical protein
MESGPDLMIFHVRYDWYRSPRTGRTMKRVVLEAPDWVNILALTPTNEILLVRQFRFGSGHIRIRPFLTTGVIISSLKTSSKPVNPIWMKAKILK